MLTCRDKVTKRILQGLSLFSSDSSLGSVSILATKEMLFLLEEDHQWSKSQPEGQTSSGQVTVQEGQPISCVSSVHQFSSDPCRLDLKLYDEVCGCIFTTDDQVLIQSTEKIKRSGLCFLKNAMKAVH